MEQYPDAVEYLSEALQPNVKSFIIDAEIVGVVSTGESDSAFRLLPFPGSIYTSRHKTEERTISTNPHLCVRFATLERRLLDETAAIRAAEGSSATLQENDWLCLCLLHRTG
jgi:hypothetical protein